MRVGRVIGVEIGLDRRDRLAERPRDDTDAVIVMIIAGRRPGDVRGEVRVVAQIAEQVGALRIRIIIAVVAADRRGRVAERAEVRGAIGREIGVKERLGIGRVELHCARRAAGRRLEEDGGIFVRLSHVVIVEERGELADMVLMDELGVDLIAALLAVEVPCARILARRRDIGRIAAAEGAAVEPHEGARGRIAADGLADLCAEFLERVGRIGLDRAAEIAVRGGGEIARAGRHDHAADILRDHRALRRQAVVIAIALVAERQAVHRIAELLPAEAVDEDLRVLLVIAPRVGGDVEHAGQRLDRLQRRDAGQDLLHLGAGQRGRRARRFGGDDDALGRGVVAGGRVGRGCSRRGGGSSGGVGRLRCGEGPGGQRDGKRQLRDMRYGHDIPLSVPEPHDQAGR